MKPLILFALLLVALPGCSIGGRPQSLIDAESKMVTRYEADHANMVAVASGYDAALLQAQTNYATELHNERISQIQSAVAANPALAADGIAAASAANLQLNAQIAAQRNAQLGIQNIVTQSTATNIAQARLLDAAIRKYDNTTPFNATLAAQNIATTIEAIIPPPAPQQTTVTKATVTTAPAATTTAKTTAAAPAGELLK